MRLLSVKKKATDRFRRDTRGGCHGAKRFLLLHHTLHHGRPLLSGKSVCRLLWSWSPLLDHRRRRASLSWFLRSLAGAAPCETISQKGKGRGNKLVTEEPKPVGSGTTIYSMFLVSFQFQFFRIDVFSLRWLSSLFFLSVRLECRRRGTLGWDRPSPGCSHA
jgi:hypothetical protein